MRTAAESRSGVTSGLPALLLIAVIIIATGATIYLLEQYPTPHPTTTITAAGGTIVTSDASGYFPNGYHAHVLNFSSTHSGDVIVMGNVSFLYVTPTNLETRTMTVGSTGATTKVVVVTADYQCGTSMGQQRFFYAQMLNGGSGNAIKLDFCLVLNTAIAQGAYQGGVAHPWALWQLSTGTNPTVGVHMAGSGEDVSLVELCVEK
jgi:hypothetical protein